MLAQICVSLFPAIPAGAPRDQRLFITRRRRQLATQQIQSKYLENLWHNHHIYKMFDNRNPVFPRRQENPVLTTGQLNQNTDLRSQEFGEFEEELL